MSLELVLKADDLSKKFSISKRRFSRVLESQEFAVRKIGNEDNLNSIVELVKDASIMFSGSYLGIKEKLEEESLFIGTNSQLFTKLYASFVASQGTINYLATHEDIQRDDFGKIRNTNINYTSDDESIINNTLTHLNEELKKSNTTNAIGSKTINVFSQLSKDNEQRMQKKEFSDFVKRANKLAVTSDYYTINGLEEITLEKKKNKVQEKENDAYRPEWIKDPKIITITKPVFREEIQGNEEAIQGLEWKMTQLFGFDFETTYNPEIKEGFERGAILYGQSGTGKSLVTQYLLSNFKREAETYQIPYEILAFDIHTDWQDGQIMNLKNQLEKITKPDKLRVVLLEEMERYFPSRINTTKESTVKNIGEMLDLWNQTAYPFHGNYLIIGLTNVAGELDGALRRKMRGATYECTGPITAKQKRAIIQYNLADEITSGHVQVQNWDEIGELAVELNLGGGDLKTVTERVQGHIGQQKRPKNYPGMSRDEKEKAIAESKQAIYSDVIKKALYEIGTADAKALEADKIYRTKG